MTSIFSITFRVRSAIAQSGEEFTFSLLSGETPIIWIGSISGGLNWKGTENNFLQPYSVNTWVKIELRVNIDSDTYDIYIDDMLVKDEATFISATSSIDTFKIATPYNVYRWIDTLYIRNYVSPEPTHGEWGTAFSSGAVRKMPLGNSITVGYPGLDG